VRAGQTDIGPPDVCPTSADRAALLEQDVTCWRVANAERAALLIDGAAYFAALRRALLRARRTVHIVGWDIRSDISLDPGGMPCLCASSSGNCSPSVRRCTSAC
jgi:hypothetical protein